jgi:methylated-DNA-[protein]-cysteine S-methyltransferase
MAGNRAASSFKQAKPDNRGVHAADRPVVSQTDHLARSSVMTDVYTTLNSPVGTLFATTDGQSLTALSFGSGRRAAGAAAPDQRREDDAFGSLREQLSEYFAGERRAFDLPLALRGSTWEVRVWNALLEIPYGETRSYGELATRIGTPTAARAVGLANARNPIAVVVPCHRVIGADGSLTGYGGGLRRKRFLLDLESGRPQLVTESAERVERSVEESAGHRLGDP